MKIPLIEVHQLFKTFRVKNRELTAVRNISFSIHQGETLGLVGESGCGKSTLGRIILRIFEPTRGSIFYRGENITHISQKDMKSRRRQMQMIFQDPYASLNPRMTIQDIISEPLLVHRIGTKEERKKRVENLLDLVNLPKSCTNRFPHEFSGGQRQRIGIARAISLDPEFLICDEPISALDVSIQAEIANLLLSLQNELKLTYLFIAHDLAMVKILSTNIAVMYLGEFVEIGSVADVFKTPYHPYTQILIASTPLHDPIKERLRTKVILPQEPPSLLNVPKGCCFCNRCPKAKEICFIEKPLLKPISSNHQAACFFGND